ncbi:MAG TPA: hypothetical protein VGI39_06730 [Polyangiaceae bacterium]|jgi:hypothetical protein
MSLTAAVDTRGRFVALCDHCRSPIPVELEAADLSAAREQLVRRGWLEGALRGRRSERWGWVCPACNPMRERVPSRVRDRSA